MLLGTIEQADIHRTVILRIDRYMHIINTPIPGHPSAAGIGRNQSCAQGDFIHNI